MFGLGYTVGTFDYGYPSTSNDTDAKLAANAVDLSASFSFLTDWGWERNFRHLRG